MPADRQWMTLEGTPVEMMIEFVGGPADGKVVASDDSELEALKARMFLRLVAVSLDNADRKEEKTGTLMTWRQPSALIAEKAKAEGWSRAKIEALMPYHEYDISEYVEGEEIVQFMARYRGMV